MRNIEAEALIRQFVTRNYAEDAAFVKALNREITILSHDVYKGRGLHGHSTRQEIRNRLWQFAMNEVVQTRKGSKIQENSALWIPDDEEAQAAPATERPMHGDMRVSDIMVKSPVTISPESTVADAKWVFRTNRIGGLPVVAEGKLAGIITLADARRVSRYRDGATRIQDVMSKNLFTVRPDEKASVALRKMNEAHIGRICVVSRADSTKLLGLISLVDLRRPRPLIEIKCEYCGNVYDHRREKCPSCGAGRK